MKVDQAIAYVDTLAFLPGWSFECSDNTKRFEGACKLRVYCPNPNTDAESLVDGQYVDTITPPGLRNDFLLPVGDLTDDDFTGLTYRVLCILCREFEHEAREALRDSRTLVAPLHPHRSSGQEAFSRLSGHPVERDYSYGVV